MSTEADLLRAIRDNPDEDTPRLMYADCIEEDGDSARAEFIRVQIERARLPEHDPARRALEDREHELLAEHECAWLGVAPDDTDELTEWEFERGFLHEVAASPIFMNGPGAGLCAAHPVRRWRVMSGGGTNFHADLREAGQRAWCGRLEALDLTGWYGSLGELSGFLTLSHFARLRELDLTGRGPLVALPEIVEYVPFRTRLKALRCGGDGDPLDAAELVRALGSRCALDEFGAASALLTAADLGEIVGCGAFAQLTSLDLRDNQIDAEGGQAFRAARFRLRELDLSGTPLGGAALDRVLGAPSTAELRALHINRCGVTPDTISELAGSPFWSQAEELRMRQQGYYWQENVDDPPPEIEGAEAASLNELFAAPGSPNLRVLDIATSGVRDAGVVRLCAAPWAAGLAYLDLSQNHLSDEALRELARCGRFTNLRTLHLNGNSVYQQANATESITDAGLHALANCAALANLRVLSLSGTRVTADGIEAVLNSPHFRLTGLRLANCQLRTGAVEVLASSPRTARLEVLDLSGNDELGPDHLEPLAESEYLSPLTELDVRGTGASASVRAALRARLGRRLSE